MKERAICKGLLAGYQETMKDWNEWKDIKRIQYINFLLRDRDKKRGHRVCNRKWK